MRLLQHRRLIHFQDYTHRSDGQAAAAERSPARDRPQRIGRRILAFHGRIDGQVTIFVKLQIKKSIVI
jgi:hypothetical protein